MITTLRSSQCPTRAIMKMASTCNSHPRRCKVSRDPHTRISYQSSGQEEDGHLFEARVIQFSSMEHYVGEFRTIRR